MADLSGLKELRELRRQVQEYEILFANMPVMLWYKDNKNTTVRINDAAAAFEGVDRSLVEGKSSWEVYPKAQADAFWADDQAVLNSGEPKMNIIEQHTKPTGEEMWVQTSKVPLRNHEDKVVGVIAIAMDITRQMRAQKEVVQKNRALERIQEFLRSTFEQMLEAGNRGADREELLATIRQAHEEYEKIRRATTHALPTDEKEDS